MERKKLDFGRRSQEDQQAFITQTWCDHCQKADLGMSEPNEFAIGKTVVIEGKCNGCGEQITTELTNESF